MASGDGDRYRLAAELRTRRGMAGAAIAAGVVLCVAAAFAYTSGLLSPGRLTQGRVIDRFEQVNGPHPGFRRNHAKGVCFSGWFDSDGAAQSLSSASVFRSGRTPIFGRFALAGGQPYQADAASTVRSMAVDFQLAHGEAWRTGVNNIPVFPVRDIRSFYEQLAATAPDPRTGKPDPARVAGFLAAHPESARAMALIKAQPPTSGFADATYNSLNAFVFVNDAGRATPVRWSMAPEDPPQAPAEPAAGARNTLFDQVIARIQRGPLRYRLMVTVGGPGDPTSDATQPWPASRPQVQAGVLTIAQVQDETHGACRDVTFDPLILPRGILASDDPILSARAATYAPSFRRRAGEPAPQPAVVIPANQEGASPMTRPDRFPLTSRLLHWSMALLIIVMLFIGIGMVTAPDDYHRLVSVHRPIGALILLLAAIRLVNRLLRPAPPLPEAMPTSLRLAASGSHLALYVLMIATPLVGWAMLSAGAYPVRMFGGFYLPPIMPHDAALFAFLRTTHTVLAVLLFATFLMHLGAALLHATVFRDGVFESMAG